MIRIEALTSDHTAADLSSVRIAADAADVALLPKMIRFNRWGQTYINFAANGANGGTNETGIKRLRSLLKAADKNGIGVVFSQPAHVRDELNAPLWGLAMRHITRSQLEALIG
jgi:hypothetical protein